MKVYGILTYTFKFQLICMRRQVFKLEIRTSESWAITNHVKFNKSKCQSLCLGRSNPGLYRLEDEKMESSHAERNLKVLVYSVPGQPQRPTTSWGASSTALLAGQRKGLSCSTQHCCGLTSNAVCSVQKGHKTIREFPKEG